VIVDTENNLSEALLFAENPFLEKPGLGPFHAATALEASIIQDLKFGNPLDDNTLITPSRYTSGFLAARADIERKENTSWHFKVPNSDMDSISKNNSTTPPPTATEECVDKEGLRTSTPNEAPPAQRPVCAFREFAHHDFTEQFPDEHDPKLFWRRRTMVFGTNP